MSLNAQGYYNALRSYLNMKHYAVNEVDSGRVVLKEKVYFAEQKEKEYKVRLSVPGEAIVIKLDKKNSKGNSDPLFHFLDDTGKPWSKRCDFVIFHRHRERLSALCLEFKSTTFPDGLIDQLESGEAWCRSLHSILRHYTGKAKKIHLTKYVISCHPNPAPHLDAAGKYLNRDHSIRHYSYQEINDKSLDELENTNVITIG